MLGYDLVEKDGRNTLQVNEEGSAIVPLIFELFLQGMTMAEIAH